MTRAFDPPPRESGTQETLHLALIGDSTVADYPGDPRGIYGWGQALRELLTERGVRVTNFALGGRSSKSFFHEANWRAFLDLSPPPDFLLIQFGHNDLRNAGKGPSRETTPDPIPAELPTEGFGSRLHDYYRHNLAAYIGEARHRGVTPILVTPMERLRFADGALLRLNEPYAQAVVAVAKELGVEVIDLNGFSAEVFARLGHEGGLPLHITLPDGRPDASHHTREGALLWARYICDRLVSAAPDRCARTLP